MNKTEKAAFQQPETERNIVTNNFTMIPDEMKEYHQWILWRKIWNDKRQKYDKLPYQANGKKASSTDPSTWTSYADAIASYNKGGFDGIGFVFTPNDPFCGVDLDKVDGWEKQTNSIINRLSSYTEISPSGNGYHIIIEAKVPGDRNRKGAFEIYDRDRFFTFTGNRVQGTPSTVEERQTQLNEIYREIFGGDKKLKSKQPEQVQLNLSDQEIIDLACNARNGAKFKQLYSGDHSEYESQSEADLALVNMIAFYTQDPQQIDRIFSSSGLYREKWDRDDIKSRTIEKALNGLTNTYQSSKGKVIPMPAQRRSEQQPHQTEIELNDFESVKRAIESTGRYAFNEYEYLCFTRFTKEGLVEKVPISNFVAWPVREIIEDNGLEYTRVFEIKGFLAGGKPLPSINVTSDKFASLSWVQQGWGILPNVEPGTATKDRLRHATQSLAQNVKVEHIYTHLGWREINGKWVYLHANGAIGAEGLRIDVEREGLQRYGLPESTKDLKESILKSFQLTRVASKKVTYPLLAMVGLAPLCEAFRQAGEEPSFVLWILGGSGQRKSTLAAAFLSHFGNFPNGKTLPASFKDTANAIEKKSFVAKDTILLVDDYHPSATIQEGKRMEQIAQQLLRGYGDHVGRTRMRPDGTIRAAYIPRGLCLVTGEDTPGAGTSTTARFFTVEIEKGSVDLQKLSESQQHLESYAEAMRGYIEWLAPKINELKGTLRDAFKTIRDQAARSDQHGRIAEEVAWLYVGLNSYTSYAVEYGVLNENQQEKIMNEAYEILLELAGKHAQSMVGEQPVKMFLTALQEMMETGAVTVPKVNKLPDEDEESSGDLVGYQDDKFLYLIPDTTYTEVFQFYQRQGKKFPISKPMLLKALEADGLIQVEKKKDKTNRTLRKQINGKMERYIWLTQSALIEDEEEEI